MRTTSQLSIAALLLTAGACTVSKTTAPPMTGPSELALRVALQITPDSILQDGASQASLSIETATPDGRPVRGLSLRVSTMFDGIVQDFGTLSAKTVVTGEDGRARVIYTAPPRPAEPVEQGNVVALLVEPIGNDYTAESPRSVTLRLVTPGVLLPPNSTPEPEFQYSPSAPLPATDIVFDASNTLDEGVPCGSACNYRWEFGDGTVASGIFVKHQYIKGGTFQVKLTVTDVRGASATLARSIQVGELVAPTAAFTFSPTSPTLGQTVFFNAEASRPAAGRRLVSYEWDFGSGRTGTGVTTSKAWDIAGGYSVTLTVTDDAGAKASISQTVAVVSGTAPTASFTYSPSSPAVSQTIFFTAEASRAVGGKRIVSYEWNFGSGRTATGMTQQHAYSLPNTYTVTLTVTDDAGLKGTTQQTITIGTTAGPSASIFVSPTSGTPATNFVFDASASTGPSPIVQYHFVFGDTTPDQIGPSPRATHIFSGTGSFVVSVTVTDALGRTAVARVNVSVQAQQ